MERIENDVTEIVEWGIRRKSLYERQRNAFRELENMEDDGNGKKQCSSSNS